MTLRLTGVLRLVALISATLGVLLVPAAAQADPSFYASPLFGIATTPNGGLFVADAGQGIVDADSGALVAALPGVNDVAPIGEGELLAGATAESSGVWRVSRAQMMADTGAFET